MKRMKHTEEKTIGAVKQLEAGRPVKEIAREQGVTDQTLEDWKSKYGGMEVSDARNLIVIDATNLILCYRMSGGQNGNPGQNVYCPRR
jgi:putative transposase